MTTENETIVDPEVHEVEEMNTNEETTQETPSTDEAPEATKSEEETKQNRAGFWQRQQNMREESERLRQENEYLRKLAIQNQAPTAPQTPVQADPSQPNLDVYLEQGRTPEEWASDNFVYLKQKDEKVNRVARVQTNFSHRMQAYSKNVPDIFQMAKDIDTATIPAVQEAILNSEAAPQIIQRIHENPELAEKLNNSGTLINLGANIKEIELMSVKEVKQTFSGAPKPAIQPKGEPIQSGSVDLSKMSKAEYIAYRQNQRK